MIYAVLTAVLDAIHEIKLRDKLVTHTLPV